MDTYLSLLAFTISKSPQKFTYTQTYMKIDAVIAYVGGLIGSIISIFFVMNAFSGTAFLISAAQKVFKYNKNIEIDSRSFNFFHFIKMMVKSVL